MEEVAKPQPEQDVVSLKKTKANKQKKPLQDNAKAKKEKYTDFFFSFESERRTIL